MKYIENDRLIGFLPPFHSLGLTGTVLMPLCGAVRTVYYPNPIDADTLAKLIEAYKVTLLIGTPTFLGAIARVASPKQLSTLRLAVTGAEACPEKVYEALKTKCENALDPRRLRCYRNFAHNFHQRPAQSETVHHR